MDHPPRAPRKEVHAPTTVHSDESAYDAELCDISDSGAAIEFDLNAGNQEGFNIGHAVEVDVTESHRQRGRVIRHYDGGFAMRFDDKP